MTEKDDLIHTLRFSNDVLKQRVAELEDFIVRLLEMAEDFCNQVEAVEDEKLGLQLLLDVRNEEIADLYMQMSEE